MFYSPYDRKQQTFGQRGLLVVDRSSFDAVVLLTCLQIRGIYSDVKVATLYDVLHDPIYRKTWDPSVLEGEEICRIDANNDVGYYASVYIVSSCI